MFIFNVKKVNNPGTLEIFVYLQRVNFRDLISEAVLCYTVRRSAWPPVNRDWVPWGPRQPLLSRFPWRWRKEPGAGVILWRHMEGIPHLGGDVSRSRDGRSVGQKELVGVNNLRFLSGSAHDHAATLWKMEKCFSALFLNCVTKNAAMFEHFFVSVVHLKPFPKPSIE